jgi:hypothetical protein
MATAPETAQPSGIDRAGLVIGVAVGIPATVAVGAVLAVFRDAVNSTNVAGVVTALGAVVSFDFFMTEPYLSLTIDSRDDVETTILLLVAGVFVGTLAARQRVARWRAGSASAEIRRIHRVAEAASSGADAAAVIATAQVELCGLLSLREARFEGRPYRDDPTYPRLARNGHLEVQRTMHDAMGAHGGGFELPRDGTAIPVLARGHEVGRFVLLPTPGTGTSMRTPTIDRSASSAAPASTCSSSTSPSTTVVDTRMAS